MKAGLQPAGACCHALLLRGGMQCGAVGGAAGRGFGISSLSGGRGSQTLCLCDDL